MKNKNIIIQIIAVGIIALAIGFFGGMKYQSSKSPSFGNRGGNFAMMGNSQRTQGGTGGMRMGGRGVSGDIISADEKSITVKLQDGSSKIVILSDSTQINKADKATKTDLTTGEKVMVFGTENSDGSVTASNIQLNPAFPGFNGALSGTPRP